MHWFVISTLVGVGLYGFRRLALPRLLRLRGVEMLRTKGGTTLVFDSTDASGEEIRLLNVDGTFQSVSYTSPELRCELACVYHREMVRVLEERGVLGRSADEAPARVLVMGGGGYSLPKYLVEHDECVRVSVVEIDPEITRIARESFFLDEVERAHGPAGDARLELVEGDAWEYLLSSGEWDAIVNDAFSGNKPIGELGRASGMSAVREHLAEGGLYIANVRGPLEGAGSRRVAEARGLLEGSFGEVALIPEWPDEPRRRGNNVFVASGAPGAEGTSEPAGAPGVLPSE